MVLGLIGQGPNQDLPKPPDQFALSRPSELPEVAVRLQERFLDQVGRIELDLERRADKRTGQQPEIIAVQLQEPAQRRPGRLRGPGPPAARGSDRTGVILMVGPWSVVRCPFPPLVRPSSRLIPGIEHTRGITAGTGREQDHRQPCRKLARLQGRLRRWHGRLARANVRDGLEVRAVPPQIEWQGAPVMTPSRARTWPSGLSAVLYPRTRTSSETSSSRDRIGHLASPGSRHEWEHTRCRDRVRWCTAEFSGVAWALIRACALDEADCCDTSPVETGVKLSPAGAEDDSRPG